MIAKSFARIHWQNLIDFGLLPVIFENAEDYDSLKQDDVLRIEHLRRQLQGHRSIRVENDSAGDAFHGASRSLRKADCRCPARRPDQPEKNGSSRRQWVSRKRHGKKGEVERRRTIPVRFSRSETRSLVGVDLLVQFKSQIRDGEKCIIFSVLPWAIQRKRRNIVSKVAIEKIDGKKAADSYDFEELRNLSERIRQRALETYTRRGGGDGSAVDDWLNAERGLFWIPGIRARRSG